MDVAESRSMESGRRAVRGMGFAAQQPSESKGSDSEGGQNKRYSFLLV